MKNNQSRRNFLKSAGAVSCSPAALGVLGSMAAMQEAAAGVYAGSGGYKALVCIFLNGGNDSYDTVIASDSTSVSVYNSKRFDIKPNFASGAADSVLEIQPGVSLHHKLSYLQGLYTSGRMAVVANVGPLLVQTDRSLYNSRIDLMPQRLFSHNDQVSIWLTGALEGQSSGWGAGMSRYVEGRVQSPYESISLNAFSAFSSWNENSTQRVSNFAANAFTGSEKPLKDSHITVDQIQHLFKFWGRVPRYTDEVNLLPLLEGTIGHKTINNTYGNHVLEKDYVKAMSDAYSNWDFLSGSGGNLALSEDPEVQQFRLEPNNDLKLQLLMVADIIKSSQEIGTNRQVFYVQLGGFDTHNGQTPGQFSSRYMLMERLNDAVMAFDESLAEVTGLQDKVTTFTASDFGRKILQNGDGTDHAWGGHHFVIGGPGNAGGAGGQVKGGQIFGRMPQLNQNLETDPQLLFDGTMVPEVSVDHFGWELAKWFGVPESARSTIFPNYFAPKTVDYSGQPFSVAFMR